MLTVHVQHKFNSNANTYLNGSICSTRFFFIFDEPSMLHGDNFSHRGSSDLQCAPAGLHCMALHIHSYYTISANPIYMDSDYNSPLSYCWGYCNLSIYIYSSTSFWLYFVPFGKGTDFGQNSVPVRIGAHKCANEGNEGFWGTVYWCIFWMSS